MIFIHNFIVLNLNGGYPFFMLIIFIFFFMIVCFIIQCFIILVFINGILVIIFIFSLFYRPVLRSFKRFIFLFWEVWGSFKWVIKVMIGIGLTSFILQLMASFERIFNGLILICLMIIICVFFFIWIIHNLMVFILFIDTFLDIFSIYLQFLSFFYWYIIIFY